MKNFSYKSEKPKNDVHYYRVSSQEQTFNFSLDNQEKFCTEFSHRTLHNVLQSFREEGESAKTTDRTKLQQMMMYCERNKKNIDRIVVYKVDRLARNTANHLSLRAFFNKLGISLASATENLEDTPSGKFNETILSAVAQLDNDVRSIRTSEGMRARLLKGLWSGVAPWGYLNTTDKLGNKIIIPHPEKAPVVKMLYENYVTGKYTFRELAIMANKMGMKSKHGLKISKQLVAKIIANPIYYGMITVLKFQVSVMGSHEPIISEKLYRQAQDVRHGINIGRKNPRNLDNPNFPLRGIKCDGCGKNMSGGPSRSKTKKYYQYYGCYNKDCLKRKAISKIDMEKDFTKFLAELTPNDDFFDILKEAIKMAHKTELSSVTSSERKLNANIAEIKDKKEKLLDLRIEGKISDEDFVPANEKYKLQIEALRQEMNNLSTPEFGLDNIIDSSIYFLKHLPETWKDLDVKDLRVLRTLLFPQNIIYTYPAIKTLELCPIYNVKSQFGDEKNRLVSDSGREHSNTNQCKPF